MQPCLLPGRVREQASCCACACLRPVHDLGVSTALQRVFAHPFASAPPAAFCLSTCASAPHAPATRTVCWHHLRSFTSAQVFGAFARSCNLLACCSSRTCLPVSLCTPAPARPALCHRLRARCCRLSGNARCPLCPCTHTPPLLQNGPCCIEGEGLPSQSAQPLLLLPRPPVHLRLCLHRPAHALSVLPPCVLTQRPASASVCTSSHG